MRSSCAWRRATQLRNSAQLSCATHRNSTATRSQLLRNSAATPHSDCLWAALPGFYDPTRYGEPAYGPGEGVGEIPVRFLCVGGQRFRRKASCNCCATPPQLLRNSAATRPQLLATQLRNSPQLPRNSRVAQLLRTSCELRTWSVTWTDGCAPEAARRPGDSRTGVSLPATLHHNMLSVLRTIGIVGHLMA